MKTPLTLASLLLTSLVASADTAQAPTPPPPPDPHAMRLRPTTCDASGDVLIEIDHRAVASAKLETSELVVYATGAWTLHVTKPDGKAGRQASGCLRPQLVAQIRKELDAAAWKLDPVEAACAAISESTIEYRVRGKLRWTEEMCPSVTLDEQSVKALADITKILDQATAPATVPCCKK